MLKHGVVAFLCLAVALGQTKPAAKPAPKPAAKPAAPAAAANALPSEDAVNSFMYQMVGYSPTATWKIADIRPTEVPGLAEVLVVITDQQGSNTNKFYVSADGKHAITGDIIPFGAKPFEEDRLK